MKATCMGCKRYLHLACIIEQKCCAFTSPCRRLDRKCAVPHQQNCLAWNGFVCVNPVVVCRAARVVAIAILQVQTGRPASLSIAAASASRNTDQGPACVPEQCVHGLRHGQWDSVRQWLVQVVPALHTALAQRACLRVLPVRCRWSRHCIGCARASMTGPRARRGRRN